MRIVRRGSGGDLALQGPSQGDREPHFAHAREPGAAQRPARGSRQADPPPAAAGGHRAPLPGEHGAQAPASGRIAGAQDPRSRWRHREPAHACEPARNRDAGRDRGTAVGRGRCRARANPAHGMLRRTRGRAGPVLPGGRRRHPHRAVAAACTRASPAPADGPRARKCRACGVERAGRTRPGTARRADPLPAQAEPGTGLGAGAGVVGPLGAGRSRSGHGCMAATLGVIQPRVGGSDSRLRSRTGAHRTDRRRAAAPESAARAPGAGTFPARGQRFGRETGRVCRCRAGGARTRPRSASGARDRARVLECAARSRAAGRCGARCSKGRPAVRAERVPDGRGRAEGGARQGRGGNLGLARQPETRCRARGSRSSSKSRRLGARSRNRARQLPRGGLRR